MLEFLSLRHELLIYLGVSPFINKNCHVNEKMTV